MVTREIKAHKAIDNPFVMPLIDCEIVTKRDMKEARMLFPYHKVNVFFYLNYFPDSSPFNPLIQIVCPRPLRRVLEVCDTCTSMPSMNKMNSNEFEKQQISAIGCQVKG